MDLKNLVSKVKKKTNREKTKNGLRGLFFNRDLPLTGNFFYYNKKTNKGRLFLKNKCAKKRSIEKKFLMKKLNYFFYEVLWKIKERKSLATKKKKLFLIFNANKKVLKVKEERKV
jgi:hypothetical protein